MKNAAKSDGADFAFSALLFAMLAWLLLHLALFTAGAGPRVHAFAAMFGVGAAVIPVRRYRMDWVGHTSEKLAPPRFALFRLLNLSCAASAVLLLLIGAAFGTLLMLSSAFLMSTFAVCLTFVPWSRIRLCRLSTVASIAVPPLGALIDIAALKAIVPPMDLAIGAWALMAGCLYACCRGIFLADKTMRAQRSGTRSDADESRQEATKA
jgi:hypothetical protein